MIVIDIIRIIITIIVNIINMILLFQRTTAICTIYYIFQADVLLLFNNIYRKQLFYTLQILAVYRTCVI